MGTSGTVFESLLAREGPFSAFFENLQNLASSSCGLGSGNTGNIIEPGRGVRRYPISELHLGKFTDSVEFQSWSVNFKTEVCANSILLQVTMQWIKEVEMAKSIHDLMTSQSITGPRDFTDYEMLDAKIAPALDRFLRGRQIALHSKKSKKSGVKGSVALLKESIQSGCMSQDSHPRKSKGRRKIGIKTRRQIVQGHLAPHQNSVQKGSIARSFSKV